MTESIIASGALAKQLREFAADRDWEQFHTPKNVATALTIECAELLEKFRWDRGSKGWHELRDPMLRMQVEEELADILLGVIRFADLAGIDLESAAHAKLQKNAENYPVASYIGSDKKYNE